MKQRFSKSLHIINCLVSYCHHAGAVDYEIRFTPERGHTEFLIRAEIHDMNPERLDELDKALRLSRSHEVEQDYWELGGEADCRNELTLIGMMLDEASAMYNNDTLEIVATRKE